MTPDSVMKLILKFDRRKTWQDVGEKTNYNVSGGRITNASYSVHT